MPLNRIKARSIFRAGSQATLLALLPPKRQLACLGLRRRRIPGSLGGPVGVGQFCLQRQRDETRGSERQGTTVQAARRQRRRQAGATGDGASSTERERRGRPARALAVAWSSSAPAMLLMVVNGSGRRAIRREIGSQGLLHLF